MAYNHAHVLLNDRALAEDATQESFLKAFENLHSFRGVSFRGWLLRIVTNTAYDMLRRSGRHPAQPLFPEDENGEEMDSAAWLADPNANVQAAVEQNELHIDIQNALNTLPEAFRSVITLVDIQDFDYAEAAQALNVPIGTVKSRLARARLQMQEKLKSLGRFTRITTGKDMCTAI
jgi:RNA polymerase sigma-70 factor (ECF subfamily)